MTKVVNLKSILAFIHLSEKLKTVLRHSWLSNNRQESDAEHSWRVALLAVLLSPYLEEKINLERVLKLSVIHDLPEIYAGDHIAWKGKLKNKHQIESSALQKLTRNLPKELKSQIIDLWEEYENAKSPEAKLTKALDKLEVIIQHDEADLKTWVKEEFKFNLTHGTKETKYSKLLSDLKKLVDAETKKKIRK